MPNRDLRQKMPARGVVRASQMIFGERQHLREVLESVQRAGLSRVQKQAEIKELTRLIQARTDELNRINSNWDRKLAKARNPRTPAKDLLRLAASLPPADYLLARTIAEHPHAPGEMLERLANHSYNAVRESVARHPNTPVEVLNKLAGDPSEPLWFLVACNPSTPAELRERLRERMRQRASSQE